MDIFTKKKHAELHARILGMKAADEFLFRLRQVKRQAVGLGEGATRKIKKPIGDTRMPHRAGIPR